MDKADQKIVQYLEEAHASETALISVLQSQAAMTPRGSYRDAVEHHLGETREHARRIEQRLAELGHARNPLQVVLGFTETVIGQTLAFTKTPFDLLRGTGGEEKVLKNAKDASATEALEIATYISLERLADELGDEKTADLAASIREDEERMLQRVLSEIPKLAAAVVGADVEGNGSYDVTKTGAADAARKAVDKGEKAARGTAQATEKAARGAARETAQAGEKAARSAESNARSTARQARKVPGVADAEGQAKGAVASEEDLPISNYDSLNATEIIAKLPELSQIDLAKVDSYERKNHDRTTVLNRIETLRGQEPWPGYDELTVSDIESVLSEGDEQRAKEVIAYERAHKNRTGVITAAERETANA